MASPPAERHLHPGAAGRRRRSRKVRSCRDKTHGQSCYTDSGSVAIADCSSAAPPQPLGRRALQGAAASRAARMPTSGEACLPPGGAGVFQGKHSRGCWRKKRFNLPIRSGMPLSASLLVPLLRRSWPCSVEQRGECIDWIDALHCDSDEGKTVIAHIRQYTARSWP
jgi:hypothetical protein